LWHQALSVGIFPYVLKLLKLTTADLQQVLLFIWTKILAFDKSCQVDLVKDGGHEYFIKFLKSSAENIYPEQQAMAAFVLAVIVDEHPAGQVPCIQAGLVGICLMRIQAAAASSSGGAEGHAEPLLLQWLCLCLGKLWDGDSDGAALGLRDHAPIVLGHLLSDPQPEVRAAATYALGTLVAVAAESSPGGSTASEDDGDEDVQAAELEIARCLVRVASDGSPLVRAEVAIAMARLAASHNWMFRQAAAAYLKPPSHSSGFPPIGLNHRSASFLYSTQFMYSGKSIEDSELWVLQVFQWVPHFTPFWPIPSKLCFFFLSSSSLLAFILQTTLLCQTHHCMENLQVPVMDLCGHGSVQKMETSMCSVLQQFTHWPEILTPELQALAVKC
jgi:regulator-associated protein of mTOR